MGKEARPRYIVWVNLPTSQLATADAERFLFINEKCVCSPQALGKLTSPDITMDQHCLRRLPASARLRANVVGWSKGQVFAIPESRVVACMIV